MKFGDRIKKVNMDNKDENGLKFQDLIHKMHNVNKDNANLQIKIANISDRMIQIQEKIEKSIIKNHAKNDENLKA